MSRREEHGGLEKSMQREEVGLVGAEDREGYLWQGGKHGQGDDNAHTIP